MRRLGFQHAYEKNAQVPRTNIYTQPRNQSNSLVYAQDRRESDLPVRRCYCHVFRSMQGGMSHTVKDNSANCQADFLRGKRKCSKSAYMVLVSAEQYSQPITKFIITAIGLSVISISRTNTEIVKLLVTSA